MTIWMMLFWLLVGAIIGWLVEWFLDMRRWQIQANQAAPAELAGFKGVLERLEDEIQKLRVQFDAHESSDWEDIIKARDQEIVRLNQRLAEAQREIEQLRASLASREAKQDRLNALPESEA